MHQSLTLMLSGHPSTLCVSDTAVVQNGSIRTYSVQAVEGSAYSLHIDVVGGKVSSAHFGGGSTPEFRCAADACRGVSIGRRDSQGSRVIRLQTDMVSGAITTGAEAQIPALACDDQGVNVTAADGSATSFCPKGGAGFEAASDGGRNYVFTSLEGESILVGVGREGAIKRVEYHGDGTQLCEAVACFGAQVSPPSAQGERIVTFTGTTLATADSSGSGSGSSLNGTLKVPALE